MSGYESFQYAASFSGQKDEGLYCYGKTMFQASGGREISCAQLLLCDVEDVRDGEAFLSEIICFPYLSLHDLLKSKDYSKQDVLGKAPVQLEETIHLTLQQKKNIAKVAFNLLQERCVVLQLPVSDSYEKDSLYLLYEVFKALPGRDRCEISFSTARNEKDIEQLKGKIRLILCDESIKKVNDAIWISLNNNEPLTEEESILDRWMNENPEDRQDIESHYFSPKELINDSITLPTEYQVLKAIYDPKSYWWKNSSSAIHFSSLADAIAELKRNPTFAVRKNRKEILEMVIKALNRSECNIDNDDDALIEAVLDYLCTETIREKKRDISIVESSSAINRLFDSFEKKYDWFGKDANWVARLKTDVDLLREICSIDDTHNA